MHHHACRTAQSEEFMVRFQSLFESFRSRLHFSVHLVQDQPYRSDVIRGVIRRMFLLFLRVRILNVEY